MARVTVEDCVDKVKNRFELVMLAAQRARSISSGAAITVERDNDKNPVVALREIAEETVELDELEAGLVKGLQKHIEYDDQDEEELDLLTSGDQFSSEYVGSQVVDEGLAFGAAGEAPTKDETDAINFDDDVVPEGTSAGSTDSPEQS